MLLPGIQVRLEGLIRRHDLNGKEGVLCRKELQTGRWLVALADGAEVSVKPVNLRSVQADIIGSSADQAKGADEVTVFEDAGRSMPSTPRPGSSKSRARSRTPPNPPNPRRRAAYMFCSNEDCDRCVGCPMTLEQAAETFDLCDCLHVRCERPMQSPFTVVFANELREQCDCGCNCIDNMLDLRKLQPGRCGLGPVVKGTLQGVAERWGFAPVINLFAVADKGSIPKAEMALRTAEYPLCLPQGSICIYTGKYNAQLFMKLFPESRAYRPGTPIKQSRTVKPSTFVGTVLSGVRISFPLTELRATVANGSLHLAMSGHISKPDNVTADVLRHHLADMVASCLAVGVFAGRPCSP